MEATLIAQYCRRTAPLASVTDGDAVPPRAAENDGRMPVGNFVLAAVFVGALLLGAASDAAPIPQFGTGCGAKGASMSHGNNPQGLIVDNFKRYDDGCGSGVSSSGRVNVLVDTGDGGALVNFDQAASTSGSSRASLGDLGAFAYAQASSTPKEYVFDTPDGPYVLPNVTHAAARSIASAHWFDTFYVYGQSNDFVVLRFSLELHGTEVSTPGSGADIGARLILDDRSRYRDDTILFLNEPGTWSTTIGFRPFSSFELFGDMFASAFALAGGGLGCELREYQVCFPGGYHAQSSATAAAMNSALFHIDVLSPGGQLYAESGHDYATPAQVPIPEPAALAMLLGGLLGFSLLGRSRLG
jgi:hypothetical protein